MSLLAVDLAAKFSAACLMADYQVIRQWDSWQKTERQFIDAITRPFDHFSPPAVMVVEDLPHRLPYMTNVKDVCRLQGRIVERMSALGALDKVLFLQPAQWRGHFEGMQQGTGPDVVVPVAARYGYTAPDLTYRLARKPDNPDRIVAGEKVTARKVATDYCAAYLIARWAEDQWREHRSYDAPRTSRYTKV